MTAQATRPARPAREIVAREQVILGPMRCLKLAAVGMSYRMFRSLVTVAILALAVAFLVHVLSFGILERSTRGVAASELSASRRLGALATRMAAPDPPPVVRANLRRGDVERMAEYERFAGDADFGRASETALSLQRLVDYFADLPPAARAVVIGDASPESFLRSLRSDERRKELDAHVRTLHLRLPDLGGVDLGELAGARADELEALEARIIGGHREAIRRLAERYDGTSAADLARHPPADLVEALREVGFEVQAGDVAGLARYSSAVDARADLRRALLDSNVRAAVARELSLEASELSLRHVAARIGDIERARWLASVLAESGHLSGLEPEGLLSLLERWQREQRLMEVAGGELASVREDPSQASFLGLDVRSRWLLVLSLVVCVVGVANALLMSVTERFAEIATMKCLGAMDRFVMMMFVFEAVLQGLVGGVVGVALGLLLSLLRGAVDFGQLLAAGAATGQLAVAGLISLFVGIVLAALAAVGPAFVASRLAPMEAMRVE